MYIFHGTYSISQCHDKQVNTWDWVLVIIIRFYRWAQLARTQFRCRFYVSWAHIISYFLDEFIIHSFQCKIGLIYVTSRSSHRGREKGRSFAGDILKFTLKMFYFDPHLIENGFYRFNWQHGNMDSEMAWHRTGHNQLYSRSQNCWRRLLYRRPLPCQVFLSIAIGRIKWQPISSSFLSFLWKVLEPCGISDKLNDSLNTNSESTFVMICQFDEQSYINDFIWWCNTGICNCKINKWDWCGTQVSLIHSWNILDRLHNHKETVYDIYFII